MHGEQQLLFEQEMNAVQMIAYYEGRGVYSLTVLDLAPGRGWRKREEYHELGRGELQDVIVAVSSDLWQSP